ncbi:BMP family lipoprotein [Clostridium grantii]|uniref:Nucleoside-binding protein n=1 Tax=Clostridium grantii DSM 8605 TaxID=1121316 RepID=A0A1M5RSW2_9CLOT|nr:BMP family ABC transporter substrate-binding protein [Clostridium grantii]SHH28893.1 nucleoside-binding protein [Clostridium grantii DSM 8605]
MKKRLVAIVASVAVVATLLAGCAGNNNAETENNAAKNNTATEEKDERTATDITVGLSTDAGGRGDKSFNDSAIAGLDKIETEYTVKPVILESQSQDDYVPYLTQLAEDNNLVFGVGFLMQSSVEEVATAAPDTNFGIIDSVVELPNVVSIGFKEQEGSFLMGVIAGKMTKTNQVGFIGGIDMPLIQRFEAGFIAGVMSVNPEAAVKLMDRSNVAYTGAFDNPQAGQEAAKKLYSAGADVIFHASGACGLGLLQEAHEQRANGKDVWAIGVDSDQAAIVPEYADAILSSMMKRVDTATYDVSKALIEGNFKGGEVVVYGLAEEGVGLAPTTDKNTPADVVALCESYKASIVKGDIVVPEDLDAAKAFVPVEVK